MAIVLAMPVKEGEAYVPSDVLACVGCGHKCWVAMSSIKFLQQNKEAVEPICTDCMGKITPTLPGGN